MKIMAIQTILIMLSAWMITCCTNKIGEVFEEELQHMSSHLFSPSLWTFLSDNSVFELLWICINRGTFIAAIYHRPKPIYLKPNFQEYLKARIMKLMIDL